MGGVSDENTAMETSRRIEGRKPSSSNQRNVKACQGQIPNKASHSKKKIHMMALASFVGSPLNQQASAPCAVGGDQMG